MVQRPDDTRTETVQLLHGLRPQAERQVRIQAVVPEKPTTKPSKTEGSECRRHAEESSEKTEHLIDHRTRCRLSLQGFCTALHGATKQSQRFHLYQSGLQHTGQYTMLQFPSNSLADSFPRQTSWYLSCRIGKGLQIHTGSLGLALPELPCMITDNCLSSANDWAREPHCDQRKRQR